MLVELLIVLLFTGCAETSDLTDTATKITKGQITKLETSFKNKYHYEIALARYAEMKRTYSSFCSRINKMKTSAKVDKKMSDFHSEDIEKEKSAYKMLQDAMIANQMPKFADATPADLQKKITVGSHRFSGEECYNALLKYKENIANLQAKVNSNNRSTTISSEDVSKLEKYILQMQQKLLQVEQILDDYVKYQDFYLAGKDIESFDLSHSQVSDFSEIDEKIKRQAEEFRIMADDILQGNIPVAIQSELNRPNINITGNDLR